MFLDSHTHMVSRTTDDYERMAAAGVVACIEPSFWLGQPRTNVGSYIDYLSLICGFERFRAGQFGIRHYCTVGLNPKEANNEERSEEHTSELQSPDHLVCRLLLEKKKTFVTPAPIYSTSSIPA